MKRFIKTFTISRVAMVIVKQDADANVYRVLYWPAEDEHPKELEQVRYVPGRFAKVDDVQMHQAEALAIKAAQRIFESKRDERRRLQGAGTR
jgi:hypothetical protein